MINSPKKLPSKKGEYSKPSLKKRIDSAMEAFLSSGKTVQRWAPELLQDDSQQAHSRQRD